MKYQLIINQQDGSFTPKLINQVVRAIECKGGQVTVTTVTKPGETARSAWRICNEIEQPFIIVGGGDRTINGVINGLPFGKATVGIIPLGASNVLAHELGIRSLEDAISRILRGTTCCPTVGLLQTERKKQYFLRMAGIGVDGLIYEAVGSPEHSINKKAHLMSAFRWLASWERGQLEIYSDEMRINCHGVIICNSAHYHDNLMLAPEANLFSPELQVVCIKDDRRRSYLKLIINGILNRYPETWEIRRFSTRKIIVTGKKAVQADGIFFSFTPARISVVEQFAKFVI